MKNLTFILIILTTFLACKNEKKETAQTVQPKKEAIVENKQENDWVILFDGSSMDAWRGYLMDSMPSGWSIEDGAMAFTPVKGCGQDIITKEKFENFELYLEWKISEKGNSGIFWGVLEDKDARIYESALEVQVLDNQGHPDAKNGTDRQAGALYDMVSPSKDVSNPAGKWNKVLIKVNHKTNEGSSSLNGTVIATFPLHGEKWDELVANSKFKTWDKFAKSPNGHIGLQDHCDKVWFRNIKIRKL